MVGRLAEWIEPQPELPLNVEGPSEAFLASAIHELEMQSFTLFREMQRLSVEREQVVNRLTRLRTQLVRTVKPVVVKRQAVEEDNSGLTLQDVLDVMAQF